MTSGGVYSYSCGVEGINSSCVSHKEHAEGERVRERMKVRRRVRNGVHGSSYIDFTITTLEPLENSRIDWNSASTNYTGRLLYLLCKTDFHNGQIRVKLKSKHFFFSIFTF